MSNWDNRVPSGTDLGRRIKQVGMGTVALGTLVGGALFVLSRFRTAHASTILTRSGFLVKDIQVGRQFIRWPFQHVDMISLEPRSFQVNLDAMSKEKLGFKLPGSFTVGPNNHPESLKLYARYMHHLTHEQFTGIVHGIIDGETRTLAAGLGIEEIFSGREAFRFNMIASVEEPLKQLGLRVFNANLKELADDIGSNYFLERAKRIQAEARNKALIEIAEQNKDGTIGEKERNRDTRRTVAEYEATAVLSENARQQEITVSSANLAKIMAEQDYIVNAAKIKAKADAEIVEAQKNQEVQRQLILAQTERERAVRSSKMIVDAETLVIKTKGDAEAIIKKADGEATSTVKRAEGNANAMRLEADATLYRAEALAKALQIEGEAKAQAELALLRAKATGTQAELDAQAIGQRNLLQAQADGFERLKVILSQGGDQLLAYKAMESGVYVDLARAQASAVVGMQPKITIWSPDGKSAFNNITDATRAFVPMLDTLHRQTGFKLPDWIIQRDPKGGPKGESVSKGDYQYYADECLRST